MAKIKDFTPDPKNANRGTVRGLAALDTSLRKHGAGRSILVDKNNRVIAGNKTLERAADVGIDDVVIVESDGTKLVAVKRTDLDLETDPAARSLAYYDNRVGELDLEWEPLQIAADLEAGLDLDGLFNPEELAAMLEAAGSELLGKPKDAEPQIDRAKELQAKWGTATGQVWQLGRHRLIVGDCTDRAVVERLMEGERAEMLFTDPPYGVDYTGGHFHSGNVNIKRERPRLANDKSGDIYAVFLPVVLPFIDGPCYVWFADRGGKPVFDAVSSNGCEIHAMIIWNKINATYAAIMAQYHQRHEPCLYFKPKKSTLRWDGPGNECTIWEVKRDSVNEFHPTQKPVELALRAIGNHKAQLVLDCFLGSGSTLIACENLNRQCRGIEIDPGYCAITIQRWVDLIGQQPQRVSG